MTNWREEPLETDAVFEGEWDDWALKVKTQWLDSHANEAGALPLLLGILAQQKICH
jgi:hypothetical protein